jgi:hypothetical protein
MHTDQPTLFDDDGTAGRDLALAAVAAHADPDWADEAYEAGVVVAQTLRYLIALDVGKAVPDYTHTHEPRALGAVMKRLARNGIIRATDEYVTSGNATTHASPRRIWESLVWRERAVRA